VWAGPRGLSSSPPQYFDPGAHPTMSLLPNNSHHCQLPAFLCNIRVECVSFRKKTKQQSRAIAGRTARCRRKFRCVSNFTTASCGFPTTARLSCWSLSAYYNMIPVSTSFCFTIKPLLTFYFVCLCRLLVSDNEINDISCSIVWSGGFIMSG